MFILLKQVFRTLLRNSLLIASLFIVIGVIFLVASSILQLTLSINNSTNNITQKGNASKVVSNTLPSVGSIAFECDPNNITTSKVITSTLELNKSADGTYQRHNNTLAPITRDDLYYTNNQGQSVSIRKDISGKKSMLSGIEVNEDATNINDKFTFLDDNDYSQGYPIWLTTPLVYRRSISTNSSRVAGVLNSLVDKENKVLLNPHSIVYNKYGYPLYFFNKGSLSPDFQVQESVGEINPQYLDVPITADDPYALERASIDGKLKNDSTHDITAKESFYTDNIANYKKFYHPSYAFIIYSKPKNVNSYHFKINWENTSNEIAYLINNLEINGHKINLIKEAFNDAFFRFDFGLEKDLKEDVINPLYYDEKANEIVLSIDDMAFVDYNNPASFEEQIINNRDIFLNDFASYISVEISNKININFNDLFYDLLDSKDIDVLVQSEYLYSNLSINKDFLFVKKSNSPFNQIVLKDGVNISQSEYLNIFNFFDTEYYSVLILSKEYFFQMQLIWQKILDQYDGQDKKYVEICLYVINKIVEMIIQENSDDWMISQSIIDSKYYSYWSIFSVPNYISYAYSNSSINASIDFSYSFNTIHSSFSLNIIDINSIFVVLSNDYASINKKKSLPIELSKETQQLWDNAIENFTTNEFLAFVNDIKNSEHIALSVDYVKNNLTNYAFFDAWFKNLPEEYTINYKNSKFIIGGTGLSPDYAFPIVSATSPIPNAKTQAIVYVNDLTFSTLGISDNDISSYLTYNSNSLSYQTIISNAKNAFKTMTGSDNLPVYYIEDAKPLGIIWMRSYFPISLRNFIIIAGILLIVFLFLLAFVIIYLLVKSLTNNLIQPLAILLANGISLRHIIISCIANISIVTFLASVMAYVVSFFLQNSLLSILSPIIFTPISIIPFSPIIFISMILLAVGSTSLIFVLTLRRKFKHSATELLVQKETSRESKLLRKVMSWRIPIPVLPKTSLGFASTLLGRLMLLTMLGSLSLGVVVSTIIINDKFIVAKDKTNLSRNYINQIDLVDIKESTGLYKYQPYDQMGMEDINMGINSLYESGKYPSIYNKDNLVALTVNPNDNTSVIEKTYNDDLKYFTNIIFPSYTVYSELTDGNNSLLFNSVATLFALSFTINIIAGDIVLWDVISPYFPEWLVYQMEESLKQFQLHAMNKYGEIYTYFLSNKVNVGEKGNLVLNVKDVDYSKNGLYYPSITINKQQYNGTPFYVWSDENQLFLNTTNNAQHIVALNEDITLDAQTLYDNNKLYFYKYSEQLQDTKQELLSNNLVENNINNVQWKFVPAYEDFTWDRTKTSNDEGVGWNDISLKKNILKFLCLLFADEDLSQFNTKISFGIVPKNDDEETYSRVNIKINTLYDILNKPYTPKLSNANILGISDESKLVVLKNDKGEDLLPLLKWDSTTSLPSEIPIVINKGASLEWDLKVGDILKINVTNNTLINSYNLLNSIIPMDGDPINTHFTLKVKGICDDALGTRIYTNQKIANIMIGINNIKLVDKMSEESIERKSADFIPFNGILSTEKNQKIGSSIIPFYSKTGLWNFNTSVSLILKVNNNLTSDILVTENALIIKTAATSLGLDTSLSIEDLRQEIVNVVSSKINLALFKQTVRSVQGNDSLSLSISSMVTKDLSNEIFDIISNIISTIIYILISILIPLLVIIILIISFSIVEDLTRRISLMKVLGVNSKEIAKIILLMYIPIISCIAAIGAGLMFAVTYGLQFLVYNSTSIFITSSVSAPIFFIAFAFILMAFVASLIFMYFKFKKKSVANAVKF